MTIPMGYFLSITSWENDADCYKTQQFHGLSEPDTRFLIALAQLFYSMHGAKKGFGGGGWHYKNGEEAFLRDVYRAIDEVVARFRSVPGVSHQLLEEWTVDRADEFYEDVYSELITSLVGYPEDDYYSDGNYIRVFDHFQVHLYKTEVEEVTEQFK